MQRRNIETTQNGRAKEYGSRRCWFKSFCRGAAVLNSSHYDLDFSMKRKEKMNRNKSTY